MIMFFAAAVFMIELAVKIKNFLAFGSDDMVLTISDFGVSFFCAAALIISGLTDVIYCRTGAVALTEFLLWGFTSVCLTVRTIRRKGSDKK